MASTYAHHDYDGRHDVGAEEILALLTVPVGFHPAYPSLVITRTSPPLQRQKAIHFIKLHPVIRAFAW